MCYFVESFVKIWYCNKDWFIFLYSYGYIDVDVKGWFNFVVFVFDFRVGRRLCFKVMREIIVG